MGVPSGSNVGRATGSITIDVSQLAAAQAAVQAASRSMTQAMNAVGPSVDKAQNSLNGFAGSWREIVQLWGAREIVQFVAANDQLATSFRRQSVAARELAGGQAQLNDLLATYNAATGNALDQATALANVTKLMSVGFADSSQELDQFARAIRGISVAMGTSQDTVTQNLILELFTQRGARLDQLGLQYDKVKQRADELRAADKNLTEQMAYQQAVLEQANDRFGKLADSIEGQITGLENLAKAWKDFRLEIGQLSAGSLDFFGNALANWLNQAAIDARKLADALFEIGQVIGVVDRQLVSPSQQRFIESSDARNAQRRSRGSNGSASKDFDPTDPQELLDAQLEYARGLAEITRDSNRAIQDATEQFGRQRAETIRSYELGIAREAEDFARMRARQQRNYERAIVDVIRDSREREADAIADLNERNAEVRQRSNNRIAEIEADFAKRRERAQEAHSDRLMDAAGRLDAMAVYQQQRDFARSQKEAEEDQKERLDKERGNLRESLDEAQKAHNEQLEDARKADARRLEDMRLALERQRADEDEDRRIARERAAEDHQRTLDQQAIDHQLDLTRIGREAEERRTELTTAFEQELLDLGMHNVEVEKERKRAQEAELEAIAPFMKKWFNTIKEAMDAVLLPPGGSIQSNNLPPGTNYAPPRYNPVPGWERSRSSSVSIGQLSPTIIVGDTGGRSDEYIMGLVQEGMVRALEGMAA